MGFKEKALACSQEFGDSGGRHGLGAGLGRASADLGPNRR